MKLWGGEEKRRGGKGRGGERQRKRIRKRKKGKKEGQKVGEEEENSNKHQPQVMNKQDPCFKSVSLNLTTNCSTCHNLTKYGHRGVDQ